MAKEKNTKKKPTPVTYTKEFINLTDWMDTILKLPVFNTMKEEENFKDPDCVEDMLMYLTEVFANNAINNLYRSNFWQYNMTSRKFFIKTEYKFAFGYDAIIENRKVVGYVGKIIFYSSAMQEDIDAVVDQGYELYEKEDK